MTDDGSTNVGMLGVLLPSILRSLLFILCALLCYHLPTLIYKLKLTILGVQYLLFCNDKSWKALEDPVICFTSSKSVETKRVVFVRHGESTWNETFNKGSHRSLLVFVIGYVPNLIKSLLYECYLVVTGKMDSWFHDSPLSHLGLSQVDSLGNFLSQNPNSSTSPLLPQEKELVSILRGDPNAPSSQLYSSNLRRALSTVAAGFRDRLSRRPNDKIIILPCLQEISRNPDTLSITPPYSTVTPSWIEEHSNVCDFNFIYKKQCDMSLHTGNKPMDTNGLKRMLEFCKFTFEQKDTQVLICGGHSIWFRSFFRTFLPYEQDHKAKTNKIVNGGTVAFTLCKTETTNGPRYMVDPKSIVVVYGGF